MKQRETNQQNGVAKQPTRIIIADDHPRSRYGLQALLATSPEVVVVGEAADGRETVRLVEETQPHVVLMDIQMPVIDGLQATQHIKSRWPEIKIVALTMYGSTRAEALAAGVDAFLVKGCPAEELLEVILAPS